MPERLKVRTVGHWGWLGDKVPSYTALGRYYGGPSRRWSRRWDLGRSLVALSGFGLPLLILEELP
jgi:hypothetical protein